MNKAPKLNVDITIRATEEGYDAQFRSHCTDSSRCDEVAAAIKATPAGQQRIQRRAVQLPRGQQGSPARPVIPATVKGEARAESIASNKARNTGRE